EKNSFRFACIGQSEFHCRLYGYAVSAAAFAVQQRGHRAQSGSGLFFGEWLVEYEMRATAQDVSRRRAVRDQRYSDGRLSRIQPAGLFEDFGSGLRVFEINN